MKSAGIVAFAFGTPHSINSNHILSMLVWEEVGELKAPVYTQGDIRAWGGVELEYTEEESGNPPPTLRMARGAVRWAMRWGFNELRVIAARPHVWRCVRDLKAAVKEEGADIVIRVSSRVYEHSHRRDWFRPNSTQPRTRSRWNWWRRELVLRLMPFFIYKRVAS